jgi:hypothetical protein
METDKKRCECSVTGGLVNGVYWLGLGAWLGALVMLAVAAAITFKTTRQVSPLLVQPEYNLPESAGQGSNILAGLIVGNVIKGLAAVQVICAVLVFAGVAAQGWTARQAIKAWPKLNRLRVGLLIVPLAALAVSMGYIMPRMWEERTAMYNPELTQDVRKEARARFDGLHKMSERSVGAGAVCLILAGLVSGVVLQGKRGETAREA